MSKDTVVPIHEAGTPIDGEHTPSTARSREPISLLETTPKQHWFVKLKDEQGRWIWYLRIEITGWLPRRIGPFKTQHAAVRFLDHALQQLEDFDTELKNRAADCVEQRPFRHRWDACILEDGIEMQSPGNGRGRTTTAKQTRR